MLFGGLHGKSPASLFFAMPSAGRPYAVKWPLMVKAASCVWRVERLSIHTKVVRALQGVYPICPLVITTDRITKTIGEPQNYRTAPPTPMVLAKSTENRIT